LGSSGGYAENSVTEQEMLAEYARQIERGQFRGLTVNQYKHSIAKLVQRTDAKTILDYGSGSGEAWKILGPRMRVKVRCYDPAVPKFAELPQGKFDGVLCIDVLEHIVPEKSQSTIDSLFARANKFVFASTCSRPAKKCFPSGENMHVALRPYSAWRMMFESSAAHWTHVEWILKDTP
jgi:hypothetical protein